MLCFWMEGVCINKFTVIMKLGAQVLLGVILAFGAGWSISIEELQSMDLYCKLNLYLVVCCSTLKVWNSGLIRTLGWKNKSVK